MYIYIIRNIKALLVLPVIATLAMVLYGCSDDSSDYPRETKEVTIHLRTSSQDYGLSPLLRSVTAGYSQYSGEDTKSDIIMYMTRGTEVYQAARFSWSTVNNWTSRIALEPNTTSNTDPYYVYGYMPADAATVSISSTDYAVGSTMMLTNLTTVNTKDVCVITGAKEENDPTHFDIINSPTLVSPGSSGIQVKDGDNYIYVLMNHIYAKLGLKFNVKGPSASELLSDAWKSNPDYYYYSLRGIRLKKVQMVTHVGEVEVKVQTGSTEPTLTYNESTSTEQTITIFDVSSDDDDTNDAGIEITPAGIEVPAFFTPMPAGSTREIKFISTYDVYYRDTDGNITTTLVRGDCTATNDWNLKAPTGQAFGAGKAISVSATVIPTYLYQLADPDLVDPTIKIGN